MSIGSKIAKNAKMMPTFKGKSWLPDLSFLDLSGIFSFDPSATLQKGRCMVGSPGALSLNLNSCGCHLGSVLPSRRNNVNM